MTLSTSAVAACCSSASSRSRVRMSSCSCSSAIDGPGTAVCASRRAIFVILRLSLFVACLRRRMEPSPRLRATPDLACNVGNQISSSPGLPRPAADETFRRYTSSTGWLSQPAGARLFERHHRPVLVAVAMRHRADEAITPDVAARQRHADCSACGERKLGIFQA